VTTRPRIAVGTFMLESNSHAPVATREEFAANCLLEGDAFAQDWRAAHPRSPATVSGFVAAMDAAGGWDGVPLVGTLDLHGNMVRRMVDRASVLVAYRENPHTDMAERGADAARILHEMLRGMRPAAAFVKLPFIPPSVTQNTKCGPYADLIAFGQSRRDADVEHAWLGIFFDPALAAEAHRLGVGAAFRAQFNRDETQPLSGHYAADAVVEGLRDGHCVGRRGIAAGHAIELGPSALLRVGGLRVVVVSVHQQCKDPVFFEMFGLDLRAARSLIVKSRGHFRAAFDEFFPDERIVEVDVPGLTTPVLQKVPWQRVPRPIYPLDPDMAWAPPDGNVV
jgi:microcystin degradation protein MlrC